MIINYVHGNLSKQTIIDFMKQMDNFTKEQLEGVMNCIENDLQVTYKDNSKRGSKTIIHGDLATLVYLKASILLRAKQIK